MAAGKVLYIVSSSVFRFNRLSVRGNATITQGCAPSRSTSELEWQRPRHDSSLGNDAHDAAIVVRLRSVLESARATSWENVFSKMRGAFPDVVYKLAVRSGLAGHTASSKTSIHRPQVSYNPELHPLDFEWYFTASSAQYISNLMCSGGERVVFVGTPTAANESLSGGAPAVLIDRNPLVVRRFRALSPTFVLSDVRDVPSALNSARAVFFDAPWYTNDILQWLDAILRVGADHAVVAFPLFQELTRPTAQIERERILNFARRAGVVSVIDNAVSYDTPLFETESLLAACVPYTGAWRRADLVIIRRSGVVWAEATESNNVDRENGSFEEWQTYLVESQVIKLRHRFESPGGAVAIERLPGCKDYTLPSVSRRDSRRPLVDLWTSRNRVARVHNIAPVAAILASLERGESLHDAVRAGSSEGSADENLALSSALCEILS